MLTVICAWCGATIRASEAGSGVSHGICQACALGMGGVPLEGIVELTQAEYDRLPIGVIELDRAGMVVHFNAHESAQRGLRLAHLTGRHFFSQVAPCTQVPAFEGRFDRLAAAPEAGRERFEFVFHLPSGGDRVVEVAMANDPRSGHVVLLIEDHHPASAGGPTRPSGH
jgi:photoactive yellow protein